MIVSDANRNPADEAIGRALTELFVADPKFHSCGEDVVDWGIQQSLLWRLAESLAPMSLTMETGSGRSTVCLAIIGTEHVCISPDENEHTRIRQYCTDHNISTERIRFIPLKSEDALPSLDLGGRKCDFVLIDGSHAFPDPITDYFFANRYLKVGGLLAVDDIDISAVGIVHKFLITEPAYELIEINQLKTGFYRKLSEPYYPRSWRDQKINAKYPDLSYLPRRTRIWNRVQPYDRKMRSMLSRIPGLRAGYLALRGKSKDANAG